MAEDDLWKFVGYGYFICTNLSILILVELLVLGKPYISIFLVIFYACYRLNLKVFKNQIGHKKNCEVI
jgi:hypothetical protein